MLPVTPLADRQPTNGTGTCLFCQALEMVQPGDFCGLTVHQPCWNGFDDMQFQGPQQGAKALRVESPQPASVDPEPQASQDDHGDAAPPGSHWAR